jgi:pyruvate dehydrogenase (quinone)
VLEVVVDPEIPPIPPHIKKELGKKAATAMLKGDPEEMGVITKGVKQKMHEFTESIKSKLPNGDD